MVTPEKIGYLLNVVNIPVIILLLETSVDIAFEKFEESVHPPIASETLICLPELRNF